MNAIEECSIRNEEREQPKFRTRILRRAEELIMGSRENTHGDPLPFATHLGQVWGAYLQLDEAIPPDKVFRMLGIFKNVRSEHGCLNKDDAIDAVGYNALAGEVALAIGD